MEQKKLKILCDCPFRKILHHIQNENVLCLLIAANSVETEGGGSLTDVTYTALIFILMLGIH